MLRKNEFFFSHKRFAPTAGAARWPTAVWKRAFLKHLYDPNEFGSGTNKFVPCYTSVADPILKNGEFTMGVRRFFRRGAEHAEVAREIESHIAHEIDDNIGRGMSEEEARRQAYIKFGNPQTVLEDVWEWNT